MKKFFVGLFVLALSMAGTLGADLSRRSLANAEQKYMLPIGSNVNNRPARVATFGIGNRDTGWAINAPFDYTPAMGSLETVVKTRLLELVAEKFKPPVGSEKDEYELLIIASPGPYIGTTFRLQQLGSQWIIPPEVLEVKWKYGVAVGWKLQGVTSVRLRLYKDGVLVKVWDTADRTSGDSPCDIGSANSVLAMGWATVNVEYALPERKEGWWDSGDVTFNAFDGFATFNVLDGAFLEASASPPKLLESLQAPVMPPKIVGISRNGQTTDLRVEGNGPIVLEASEDLKSWREVETESTVVLASSGERVLRFRSSTPKQFFRLRLKDGVQ